MRAAKTIAEKKDSIILEQLNELIIRGLLIVELTEPTITTVELFATRETTIQVSQQCRLVLKDQEYIEKLEKRCEKLSSRIGRIDMALHNIKDDMTDGTQC